MTYLTALSKDRRGTQQESGIDTSLQHGNGRRTPDMQAAKPLGSSAALSNMGLLTCFSGDVLDLWEASSCVGKEGAWLRMWGLPGSDEWPIAYGFQP